MTRLAEIQARVEGVGELRDIVGAMRSLAGMRLQEAQHMLPAIRRYAETVAVALADTLFLMPQAEPTGRAPRRKSALILCAAEHGFVGGFNERLLDAAEAALETGDLLFVLGSRGSVLAQERGRRASWAHPMATRCAGAPATIRSLSAELYPFIARGEIARVDVIYAHYCQGSASTLERRQLLPLDMKWLESKQSRRPPIHNLEPVSLHEKLMFEYVFALLTEAVIESIASENAARFAAMASAHQNVSAKLDKLREAEREARRSEITTELLDLVIGAEAQVGE